MAYYNAPLDEDVVFPDRREAGRELARHLLDERVIADVVIGLTRGGVPVAAEVANALRATLDIIVVKKMGAPHSPELAIGAVCADGSRVLHEDTIDSLAIPGGYIEREFEARLGEAIEAERAYRGHSQPASLSGRHVIIVDDGIATGATVEAAVESARGRGARPVLAAAPVGSEGAVARLRAVADDVFCLSTPVDFRGVGQFYSDFSQVTDEEVWELLEQAAARRHEASDDS
ncbi:MAG: phosphoribosyltransferase [Chloroflexota bacterium]